MFLPRSRSSPDDGITCFHSTPYIVLLDKQVLYGAILHPSADSRNNYFKRSALASYLAASLFGNTLEKGFCTALNKGHFDWFSLRWNPLLIIPASGWSSWTVYWVGADLFTHLALSVDIFFHIACSICCGRWTPHAVLYAGARVLSDTQYNVLIDTTQQIYIEINDHVVTTEPVNTTAGWSCV